MNPQPPPTLDETLAAPPGPPAFFQQPPLQQPLHPVPPQESAPRPTTTGRAFDAETALLLRQRLLISHAAIGVVTAGLVSSGFTAVAVLPPEFGLGRWAVGIPLLMFGHSLAGFLFLARSRAVPLDVLRLIEVTQFAALAVAGGVVRFKALCYAPPGHEPAPELLYRYAGAVTNFPFIFGVIMYGVLIPNTRRRGLILAGSLCAVPVATSLYAYAVNPHLREVATAVVPLTLLPLLMAVVISVYSADRCNALRREAFEARREADQVGPYTLVRMLGKGGMGDVWLAEHRLLKRPCAVKFIRPELAANPVNAIRFEREVRAVTGLTHFNTVRIYDYGRGGDGSFYYVMEYLEGPTLDALGRTAGPLDPARVAYLLRQLCGALAEAHAAGLVHRDLKPGNILVAKLGGQHDVAKLLDFGLVQDLGAVAADDRLTEAGTVLGTPAYMCPEQAAGNPVDQRGDVYSLGAVAFFALTGRPPFEVASVGRMIAAHLTVTPPRASDLRRDVPPDLAAVVARCLEKEPADRYGSAAELERALAACACGGDWSADRAAAWWAGRPSGPGAAEPTVTPGKGVTA